MNACAALGSIGTKSLQANAQIVYMLVGKPPQCVLTFDCVQHSVVQGLAARVVGGRADACSAAVGQSVPEVEKRT